MEVFYEGVVAGNSANVSTDGSVGVFIAAPGSEFQVFELGDASRSNPLQVKVGGRTATSIRTSDRSVMPDVRVISDNYAHIFKSGTFEWERLSNDGMKKAVDEARSAAQQIAAEVPDLVVARVEEVAATGAFKGEDGKDGSNVVPTAKAIADEIKTPGTLANAALSATFVGTAGDETVAGNKKFTDSVTSSAVFIGNSTDQDAPQGLVLSNRPGTNTDPSRRMGYVFSRKEHTTAGSTFLVQTKKDGPTATHVIAIEGEVGTSTGAEAGANPGATAHRLVGVQGLIRHRSSAVLPWGAALSASVQIDSATGGSLTRGIGLAVVPPEVAAGGKIGTYYGAYIYGNADELGDLANTHAVPNKWYGLYIARGANDGQPGSLTRAIYAEGHSVLNGATTSDPVLGVTTAAEGFPRFLLVGSGQAQWGSGAASPDVFLSRRAPKVLEANGTAIRTGNFASGSDMPDPVTAGRGATAVQADAAPGRSYYVSDGTNWQAISHGLRRGVSTFNGDGVKTSFDITHNMTISAPVNAQVTPASSAAAGPHWVSTLDSTKLTVSFTAPPPAGTNNVILHWTVSP